MDVVHIVVHVREFHIHRLNQLCFELYSWLVEPVNVTPRSKESQLNYPSQTLAIKGKGRNTSKLILGGQHYPDTKTRHFKKTARQCPSWTSHKSRFQSTGKSKCNTYKRIIIL